MNKYRGVINFMILIFIISSLLLVVSINGDGEKQKPNAAERAIGFIDPFNRWEKVKSWAKLSWLKYGPSTERTEETHTDAGEMMKDAVTKSFETSKETAEHAAKVAGHAVHKTAEKVKRTVSGSGKEEDEDEL
ncbi:hypothetical protein AQUCO_02600388v1 [Aquilegia coerulea]|uniref:Uncharacterized protein n=1 Tax=Aquilegia coerulea TaxID=218851 RepID=A0A2G5D8R6_AQUCA|nr:hypothetical protein AQUCO_02600388v1 [Aquilegia coerulea]